MKENKERVKEHFHFSWQEVSGLIAAMIVFGFIFSFRDWGQDAFDYFIGLGNFLAAVLVAGISLFSRVSMQKFYSRAPGYTAEFKIWWAGLVISLIVAFISYGWVPLVLVGSITLSFYSRQRLGEFRYGFSYAQNAVAALWAIWSSLILAVFGATLLYFFPQSYFFETLRNFNLIMAACALLPIPQMEGPQAFFGGVGFYFLAVFGLLLATVLLLTESGIGITIAIIIGFIIGFIYYLKGSEK